MLSQVKSSQVKSSQPFRDENETDLATTSPSAPSISPQSLAGHPRELRLHSAHPCDRAGVCQPRWPPSHPWDAPSTCAGAGVASITGACCTCSATRLAAAQDASARFPRTSSMRVRRLQAAATTSGSLHWRAANTRQHRLKQNGCEAVCGVGRRADAAALVWSG